MKDKWYADNRDLVKWSTLLHLAEEYGAKKIVQVAYLRPSTWDSIYIDGTKKDIPLDVLRHFRNVSNITMMKSNTKIEIIDSLFSDRESYLKDILSTISKNKGIITILFLDPDTGLEPGNPGMEHVLEIELKNIWEHMHVNDLLVFYQHQTNMNGQPWIEPKRRQFLTALDLEDGAVKVAKAPGIARDVVFFYCQKG